MFCLYNELDIIMDAHWNRLQENFELLENSIESTDLKLSYSAQQWIQIMRESTKIMSCLSPLAPFKRTKYWQLISKCTRKKPNLFLYHLKCVFRWNIQTDRIECFESMHLMFWTLNLNRVSLIFVNQILYSRLFICLECIIYEPRIWFKRFLTLEVHFMWFVSLWCSHSIIHMYLSTNNAVCSIIV